MTNDRILAQAIILIASVALLNGCGGDQSLSKDAVFEPNAASDSADNAVILVGLRFLNEPIQKIFFGTADLHVHPSYQLEIRLLSADGRFESIRRTLDICEHRGIMNGAFSNCTPEQLVYKILSVPAGRYTIEHLTYRYDRNVVMTTYNTRAKSGYWDQPSRSGHPVRDPNRSFTVGPGSITYVGDLAFYFNPPNLAAHFGLERNDDAARNALSSYPNVHGTLVFQSATGSAGPSTVSDTLVPMEGPPS